MDINRIFKEAENIDYQIVYNKNIRPLNEVVNPNYDGSYTIHLNPDLAQNQRLICAAHALSHILNGDFDSDENADDIEYKRHEL